MYFFIFNVMIQCDCNERFGLRSRCYDVHTFGFLYSGGESYSSQNFARNSDSIAERPTRVKVVSEIKIRQCYTYNGAMVIGGKQRDKGPATKENGPTLRGLDPKLSERRTRESERESRLY